MTAVVNGVPVTGTPEEIAKLISLTKMTITGTIGITPFTGGGIGTATSPNNKTIAKG